MTDEKSLHISPAGVAFVKSKVRKGLLPIMLEDILNTRIMVKECMKFPSVDKNLRKILDNRQLGLKLIANVTYGYTSANFSGRMPCVEVADSIVHKGRETLERAIDYVNGTKKYGAEVIYGDTDSLFVLVRNKSKQDAFEIGKEIATEITKLNPFPVKLKFEKVYHPCVLQTKKRYVGYSYESEDQKEPVFDAKGIETVRRDTCEVVSKMLEKMIHVLFRSSGDLQAVKECLTKQFDKILSDRLPLSNFIFAKEYRGRKYYKQKASIPALKIIRENLRSDPRSEPHIHERVPYVILNGEPGCTLISCVNDPNALSSSHPHELNNLNYEYYIVKQIGPALNRILNILGADCLQWYREMSRNMHHLRTREEISVG
uniref:DNA polymerase zeta catalytic subunit n=1 Tax=Romanomermis culicivorax TaxID=13658 RepID=A0A915HU68_ROMCU